VTTIVDQNNSGQFSSLYVDPVGNARIAYYDLANRTLKVARLTKGQSWTTKTVDAVPNVGQYASLVVTSAGDARISYWDATRQDLKVAVMQGDSVYSLQIVDDGGNVGQFSSLAVDAQGDPHVSYWDNSYGAGNLKYAHRVSGVWTLETVDTTGNVGQYSSIAVDGFGSPRISYYDATQGVLKFATRNGGIWTVEVADAAANVGVGTSLALDGQGNPSIAYYDQTNHDLKLARKSGAWTVEVVDATGDVGRYPSVKLDAQGAPAISYYDATLGDLKFASRAGATWTVVTVDSIGDVGRFTSLVLDATGAPRISYWNASSRDLKFASRAGGAWTSETLQSEADVGQYTSLTAYPTTSPAGQPRVSYRVSYWNGSFNRLEYAQMHWPDIAMWAYPGLYEPAAADTIRERARTITVRWARDPVMEARDDFGGYRIYRVYGAPDTARLQLVRRFSVQTADSVYTWHFHNITEATPMSQRLATFIDADSSGAFFKRCRRDSAGKCYSPGDSVIVLLPPPGPHDGFRAWYAITYEARNTISNDYIDMAIDDAVGCLDPDRAACPNLNNKATNLIGPVEPTSGPTANLTTVAVVPNPFRASEVWDQIGGHEVHFINLPTAAKIRIYTVAGDLVAELHHNDPVRDFERWDLKNGRGQDVSSGIYIYRVEAVNFFRQDRFIVIR
jgi:hypothetical protein